MAAYEIPNLRFSGEAGQDIERRRFVTINAEEKVVYPVGTPTVIGVSMQPSKAGEVAEVADGIVMVEAGGVITGGTPVIALEDGRAMSIIEYTTANPDATTVAPVGTAITNASGAGELVSIKTLY